MNALAALACLAGTVLCFGGTFFGIWTDGRGNYQHGWPWYFCNRWDDPIYTRFLFWHGEVSWRPWALVGDVLVLLAITLIIFLVARWLRTLQRPSVSLRQGMLLLTTACVALGWWTAAAARGRSLESLEQRLIKNNCSLAGSYNDPLWLQRLLGFQYEDPAFYRLGNCLHVCEFPDDLHGRYDAGEVERLLDELPGFDAVNFSTDASVSTIRRLMRHPRLARIEAIHFRDSLDVTDEALKDIGYCRSLKHLDLSATNIGDHGLRYLLRLPHLAEVNIDRTDVSNNGLKVLASHPTLERVILDEYHFSQDSLALLNAKGIKVVVPCYD